MNEPLSPLVVARLRWNLMAMGWFRSFALLPGILPRSLRTTEIGG